VVFCAERSEKKRAERNSGGGYFLARRQDLWRRARCHDDCHVTELGAIGYGAELCYLGALAYGAQLRVQTCKLNFWGSKRKFLSPKGLKNKKIRSAVSRPCEHVHALLLGNALWNWNQEGKQSSGRNTRTRSCSS
jgi:hypothetical protein